MKVIVCSLLFLITPLIGCAYGSVAHAGKKMVVITRQDLCLWGLLRRAYVCQATKVGLVNCRDRESP